MADDESQGRIIHHDVFNWEIFEINIREIDCVHKEENQVGIVTVFDGEISDISGWSHSPSTASYCIRNSKGNKVQVYGRIKLKKRTKMILLKITLSAVTL